MQESGELNYPNMASQPERAEAHDSSPVTELTANETKAVWEYLRSERLSLTLHPALILAQVKVNKDNHGIPEPLVVYAKSQYEKYKTDGKYVFRAVALNQGIDIHDVLSGGAKATAEAPNQTWVGVDDKVLTKIESVSHGGRAVLIVYNEDHLQAIDPHEAGGDYMASVFKMKAKPGHTLEGAIEHVFVFNFSK